MLHLGHEEEAKRCWEDALKEDSAHLEANFNLGYCRWQKAEIDPYKDYYVGMLEGIKGNHGHNPDYWHYRSIIESEMGLDVRARKSADRATELGYKWDKLLPSSTVRVFA